MNLNTIQLKSINRVIAHEIHPKTEKADAYSKTSDKLLDFGKADKAILIKRITEALTNTTKTFQLDYEDKSDNSVFAIMEKYKTLTADEFIKHSISLADNLAYAHFRTKIPGGYALFGDGLTSKDKTFFFIIKAELQEVFSIQNNKLKLIEDVFLSPAKDFYKIGFFVESGSSFIPFMYDDQFSLQKKDLTEYFYGKFLGLTTDKNDKLKAKNFYEDTRDFIERNVDNFQDKIGLLKSLKVLYREDTSGIISPKDFANNYFEGDLKYKYEKTVIQDKFPHSFTKDISLIENRLELQRVSIPLTYDISLIGNSDVLSSVEIIDDPTTQTMQRLEPEINNGMYRKIILLKQANV